MRLRHAQCVQQANHASRQIAKRIRLIQTFGGLAIARHVRHQKTKVARQGADVARVVGQTGRTRATPVQHQHRGPRPALEQKNLPLLNRYDTRAHWSRRRFTASMVA